MEQNMAHSFAAIAGERSERAPGNEWTNHGADITARWLARQELFAADLAIVCC